MESIVWKRKPRTAQFVQLSFFKSGKESPCRGIVQQGDSDDPLQSGPYLVRGVYLSNGISDERSPYVVPGKVKIIFIMSSRVSPRFIIIVATLMSSPASAP